MIKWATELKKESFPNKPENLEIIQTHISYVLIADELVYKIKKPVNFGFLDFTTLELRKHFCEKEVELNRRLCPDIYLGVVPISERQGSYELESAENIVEYAVKMRKLPVDGMMEKLIRENSLTKKHIDLIVDILVPFFKNARTGEGVNEYGSIETVSFNTEENFTQTAGYVGRAINRWRYEEIVNWTRTFLRYKKDLFESRIKGGFIREGHGDLYSANICFDDLRKVYIFDCIEFNERFRCGDVASDIAFLSMDLDFHGLREFSEYFVSSYVEKSGDRDLLKVLNFYKCYRAYVRGKIGCFTSDDPVLSEKKRKEALDSARKYFDLAYLYAEGKPRVFVVFGLSGTGKSTLARALREQTLAGWIPSDIVRKSLVGIAPTEHHYEPFERGIYSREYTEKTYEKMIDLAEEVLLKGRDVILDATFRDRAYREKVARKLSFADIYWIWCVADDNVVRERFMKRKESEDISDARWEIYLAQKEKFEAPDEVEPSKLIKLDTSEGVDLVERVIERVYGVESS
ncbi:bifunctional aminoglycoside phosphotransferase/ATP-binding protein [Thermodesulfovibrio yellowstonii]|uniref:Aminoglycoside phosphotransferase n=1 Tax=Thermodesulfovibrio yellowstonii TaxID=28262 RepID=A0A9W6LKC5_9BACT|nr:bifunctional aminoglycoside phosphotransferase/ATP-binding protein [Thermodesulfovibrio islandicus]GLI52685.1 aminoglycoside phosphotransferase [Thermodesulfovibrio islandicus]